MTFGPEQAAVLRHIVRVANEHLQLLNRPAWTAHFPPMASPAPAEVPLVLRNGDRTATVTFIADELWTFMTSDESRRRVLRALEEVVWALPR